MEVPAFCQERHFCRRSRAFLVPFWELPKETAWFPEDVSRSRSRADQAALTEPLAAGPHSQDDSRTGRSRSWRYQGDDSDVHSSSDEEEQDLVDSASELDPARDTNSDETWSHDLIAGSPVLRRQACGCQCYSICLSSAVFPPRALALGAEVLDAHLANMLRPRTPIWAVLAVRSGQFAGALFRGPEILIHKTFHRYTVRAKQGGAQSSEGKARSVGGRMRLHGERRLAEEVKDLMRSWATDLEQCDSIFIAASKTMVGTLIGSRERPLVPHSRVRRLPLDIGKPTLEAVANAHWRLASVAFAPAMILHGMPGHAAADEHPNEDDCWDVQPLHAAASDEDESLVLALLDAGADPTAPDANGRVPYDMCSSRSVQRAFRFWRSLNEDAWDWTRSNVPGDSREAVADGRRRTARRGVYTTEETVVSHCQRGRAKGGKGRSSDHMIFSSGLQAPSRGSTALGRGASDRGRETGRRGAPAGHRQLTR